MWKTYSLVFVILWAWAFLGLIQNPIHLFFHFLAMCQGIISKFSHTDHRELLAGFNYTRAATEMWSGRWKGPIVLEQDHTSGVPL